MSSCSSWDPCWGSETQVLPWRCRWRSERIHRLIWRNVFGLMAIPVVVTLAVFLALVRDDRAVGPRSVSEGDRTVRWWHAAAALIRHRSMYWLCSIYGVTFGGFVGLCSVLPLFFHDNYG